MRTPFLLAALLLPCYLSAQKATAPTLKKHLIGNSGCSVYNYCQPKYKLDYSTDSSRVYTGECVNEDVTYGVICVKLLNPMNDLQVAEDLLIAYVDFLKGNFNIKEAVGYGKGHTLNNDPNTRGIVDYWKDNDNDNWKIKAWTDGKFIGFMYTYSVKELPEQKVNVFLDGFRLPDKKSGDGSPKSEEKSSKSKSSSFFWKLPDQSKAQQSENILGH